MRAFWLSCVAVLIGGVLTVYFTARSQGAGATVTYIPLPAEAGSVAPTPEPVPAPNNADTGDDSGSDADADRLPRVLFIGNSYTFTNDMPTMVAELAEANGAELDIGVVAHNGFSLSDHLRRSHAAEILFNHDWDLVVLQEHSLAPAHPPTFEEVTVPAVAELVGIAREVGTEVMFYETWGRERGRSDLDHLSFESMQDALTASYEWLGTTHSARVAPVGQIWSQIRAIDPGLELYLEDGSHPSPAGSFIAAATLTEAITGVDITTPTDIDGVTAETIGTILSSVDLVR